MYAMLLPVPSTCNYDVIVRSNHKPPVGFLLKGNFVILNEVKNLIRSDLYSD